MKPEVVDDDLGGDEIQNDDIDDDDDDDDDDASLNSLVGLRERREEKISRK